MAYERFGEFAKCVREEQGVSIEELASMLSVSPEQIMEWESGQTMPDEETLCRLADALEVNVPELEQGQYLYKDSSENKSAVVQKEILPVFSGRTKWRRILAVMLDGVLAFLGMMILVCAECIVMNALNGEIENIPIMMSLYGVMALFDLRDWLWGGRSLGKRAFGLTVCDIKTADKPTWWQLFFRHVLRIFGVDLIVILASGRSICDYIFGTVVISENEIFSWKERLSPVAEG